MNTVLVILQVLTALVFIMAGVMKLITPKEKAAERMAWVNDFSQGQVRGIGLLELLGGLGLILPPATGILPWLTPLAALGLVLTMIGAAVVHYRRKEVSKIGTNVVLGLLAAIVLVANISLLQG